MKRKLLSLLLVFAMLLGSTGTVFAIEADGEPNEPAFSGEVPSDDAAVLAAWEATLGAYTETPANAYTPAEAKNLLTAEDSGHAYDPDMGEENAPASAAYVPGEVLFSRVEGGLSLFGDDDIESELAALGVSGVEKIASFAHDSGRISLFGAGSEEVWYRASVSGDVLETVDALKELNGIDNAEPNYIYTTEAVGEPSAAQVANQWYIGTTGETMDAEHGNKDNNGLHKGWYKHWQKDWEEGDDIPAEDVQTSAPGTGVVVAVIDTGVDYTHEDLASSMWTNPGEIPGDGIDNDRNGYVDDVYGINTTANPQFDGAKAGDPMDNNGHGTHVAGIIAMANNDVGGVGIAYGAKIMAIKAGQATGSFSSMDIEEAIKYAVAMGADVINMSFGGTGKSALIEQALEDAFSTCVLVAAAGNDGLPTNDAAAYGFMFTEDIYPASYRYVLGVMASDEYGYKAGFSNWDFITNANAEYEMIAPGTNIYSAIPGNRYAEWNGTSMAAPMVAASAAVLRGYFTDKDEYNSRFIMGQLASATEDSVSFLDEKGYGHSYASLNLYDSMVNLPKPNLAVSEVFALDNKRSGTENDGDRIVDAGETIDLGIAIRNQWGKTGTVTVTADDLSATAQIPTGFVEFETDTITLEPIGTYSEADNGYVWDDSLLVDVSNPIRFKVDPDTPNDSQITINLTITTTNGLDDADNATYVTKGVFTFRVQKGAAIRGHITEDTTLTKDKYWIVENAVIVDPGATLTVEEGTQLQFWSSDYEDAYGGLTMAYLKNDGTLNMIGTEDEPIEVFPGAGFEQYMCEISGIGVETLKYCDIISPRLGFSGQSGNGDSEYVDSCDHCSFTQNYSSEYTRYLESGRVKVDTGYCMSNCAFRVDLLTNSSLNYFRTSYYSDGIRRIYIGSGCENIFNECSIRLTESSYYYKNNRQYSWNHDLSNCVFLGGHYTSGNTRYNGSAMTALVSVPTNYPTIKYILYDDASVSKYVVMEPYSMEQEQLLMRTLANELGGTLACFTDEEERTNLRDLLAAEIEKTREPNSTGNINGDYYIGYEYDPDDSAWKWDDGSSYGEIPNESNPRSNPFAHFWVASRPTYADGYLSAGSSSYDSSYFYILECPKDMTDEEIEQKLTEFGYYDWFKSNATPYVRNSAIINTVLDTDPNYWTHFTAPTYDGKNKYLLHGNYWGTENSILINKMIQDDDDFPGTLADIDEKPILTLDSPELEDIYPFVTKIWMTEANSDVIVEDAAPGVTYDVHVTYNRDMAQDIQPMITYGGEAPYTDYTVHGDWVSAREWVGSTKISSVSTGGTQIFRAKGGAAADDKWLVCGTDELRFQFDINAASAQSMVLNAAGGNGKIDLTWFQNDYELLSGYNIYRAPVPEYEWQSWNYSLIYSASNTETAYTDTDVQDGVTYYYYFKIVDTDGNEVENSQSNTASAAPRDNVRPTVTHTRVTSATVGRAVSIAAKASDNIGVKSVRLFYKKVGDSSFTSTALTLLNDNYVGTIPAAYVTGAGVQYYLEVEDTAGNKNWSGSIDVPYTITVDTRVVVNTLSPSTVEYGYSGTITLYGANFKADSCVEINGENVSDIYVYNNDTELSFVAPPLPVGAYTVWVDDAKLATKLTVRDTTSFIQINEGEVLTGNTLRLPVYVGVKGEMTSVHAAFSIPAEKFDSASFELASGVNASAVSSYRSDALTVSISAAMDFNPGSDQPLGYLVLTPRAVSEETSAQIVVTEGLINDGEANSLSTATVTVYPNFSISAIIRYFFNNKLVSDVTVKADDVSKTTDANGAATLTEIKRSDVTVTASKNEYVDGAVEAFDAVLILQYCAYNNLDDDGNPILTENQILAADVDDDGRVTEADATMILKLAVGLIDKFDAGSWIFVPASQTKTLTAATTNVSFTAIMVGDVDGSWAK